MMIFHFVRERILDRLRRQGMEKAEDLPKPEWVTCVLCDLEIPFEDAEYSVTPATGEMSRFYHRNQSCQEPFFKEKEVGHLKKPPWLLRRLPIWN